MAFRTIEITTKLEADAIRHLLQTHTHPKDGTWNVKEFDIKNPSEKTYSCTIKNNSFTLRARKTNQRRQSRPFGYGNIIKEKNKTRIHITVIPHIASILFWTLTFLATLGGAIGAIVTLDPMQFIPATLFFVLICLIYTLTLKHDAQDMKVFIQRIVKEK